MTTRINFQIIVIPDLHVLNNFYRFMPARHTHTHYSCVRILTSIYHSRPHVYRAAPSIFLGRSRLGKVSRSSRQSFEQYSFFWLTLRFNEDINSPQVVSLSIVQMRPEPNLRNGAGWETICWSNILLNLSVWSIFCAWALCMIRDFCYL